MQIWYSFAKMVKFQHRIQKICCLCTTKYQRYCYKKRVQLHLEVYKVMIKVIFSPLSYTRMIYTKTSITYESRTTLANLFLLISAKFQSLSSSLTQRKFWGIHSKIKHNLNSTTCNSQIQIWKMDSLQSQISRVMILMQILKLICTSLFSNIVVTQRRLRDTWRRQ